MTYISLLTFVLLVMTAVYAKIETQFDKHHHHEHTVLNSIPSDTGNRVLYDDDPFGAKIYKTLFKVKHREQLNAIKTLMSADETKRKSLVIKLVENIEKMVTESKDITEKANYNPNDTFPSPGKTKLRDAVANIIENTVFYSNIVLRLPSMITKRHTVNKSWHETYKWAYMFTKTAELHDDAADNLIDLAAQQLSIIPRGEDFRNPYDKAVIKEEMQQEAIRKREEVLKRKMEEKKLDRKRKKNKPSLLRTEL